MCGIAGFYDGAKRQNEPLVLLKEMGEAVAHRGPDDNGEWYSSEFGIGLSHRRLAILDLSQAGHQPMESNEGRFTLVFNGEIYNHAQLRHQLLGEDKSFSWRGNSDTETLLACFDSWGIERTLKQAIGMFAMAVLDQVSGELSLIRDRVGEKPLYYGWHDDCFLFGSELKALKCHPSFKKIIDRESISLLCRYNYIPAPYCIWKNTKKLLPGTILTLNLQTRETTSVAFWDFKDIAEAQSQMFSNESEKDMLNRTELLLSKAVKRQLGSDVPLGAFLSGGIDSSIIVALMQAQSNTAIKTFSIGFQDERYSEAGYAKKVAGHLDTDHSELYVSAEEAQKVASDLSSIYDEPFADSSAIPTFIVSRFAKEKVSVCLSGDGGDELYCGYNRYLMTKRVWRVLKIIPLPLRRLLCRLLLIINPRKWDQLGRVLNLMLPFEIPAYFGDKVHKAAYAIPSTSNADLYKNLVSIWHDPESVVLDAEEPVTIVTDFFGQPNLKSNVEVMMAVDMLSFLPDDILVKVDRAAMAVSLETRVPFLDHSVIESAYRIPLAMKYRNGKSKWPLREILYKYVPKSLIDRPKMGFGIPLDSWLRGPLYDWADNLLNVTRLEEDGFFSPEAVREKWTQHQSGARNWSSQLWSILMFNCWLDEQGDLDG